MAKPLLNSIIVDWTTQNEVDNTGFEILRSANGRDFQAIGWVNPNEINNYEFEDREVVPNQLYYYRLRQVDTNGDSRFSPVVSAQVYNSGVQTISVFPNPTSDEFSLDLGNIYQHNMNYQIQIYNSIGILMNQMSISDKTTNISLNRYAKGVYLIRITTPAQNYTVKIEKE